MAHTLSDSKRIKIASLREKLTGFYADAECGLMDYDKAMTKVRQLANQITELEAQDGGAATEPVKCQRHPSWMRESLYSPGDHLGECMGCDGDHFAAGRGA